MADFAAVLGLLRTSDDIELARILETIKKAYLSEPAPVQGFPEFLRTLRESDDKRISMLLDEMVEQYVRDNPDPAKPDDNREGRIITEVADYLAAEKEAGRPRPTREDLEAYIRDTEKVSDRQLQADLVVTYDSAVDFGLVAPRA